MARALPGWEPREGQLRMAHAVARALDEGQVLLCEAGTGTGKTLAYLLPAVRSGLKVVVSTATRALQDQVFTKDVPLVEKCLGSSARASLLKGLPNYLCRRRFAELRTSAEAASYRSLPLVERWARDTETGDLAELASLPESDPVLRAIGSSSDTRIGTGCDHFERCFVTQARREADEARLVVVNHHLFFADLAVRLSASKRGFQGASVLPPFDAVVFDEAHQLEDVATTFFGVQLSLTALEALLRDARRALHDAALLGSGTAERLLAVAETAGEAFFAELRQHLPRVDGLEGRVPLDPALFSGPLQGMTAALDDALGALGASLSTAATSEPLRQAASRAERLRADLAVLSSPTSAQVTWAEVRGARVRVGASPIELGDLLREHVFERGGPVVLASATLTTGGGAAGRSFGYVRARLGLGPGARVPIEEEVVESPFDYAESALLYTPSDLPEPSDPAFAASASERTAELVELTGGGAFVLCTSVRAMEAMAGRLRRRLPLRVMVQGEAPKGQLVARFRADGDAVLVATMSFWEGIDVPGRALRLVVIDKLPFAVPTDPLFAARSRALEAEGGNPFRDLALPMAALTLKQGFGRLIRSRADRGVVAILDRRVSTKGYGRALVSSLPPAKRATSLDDVRAFVAVTGLATRRG